MLQISEIVKKTEEMFDLFNEHFYDNELTRPAITVSPDGGRGAYGWCSINEIWNASGEKYRKINLCAEYLDRPIFELAATLLHEMAHLYNLVHDIQDVSNNGYYCFPTLVNATLPKAMVLLFVSNLILLLP